MGVVGKGNLINPAFLSRRRQGPDLGAASFVCIFLMITISEIVQSCSSMSGTWLTLQPGSASGGQLWNRVAAAKGCVFVFAWDMWCRSTHS